jgi:catechol 2,3-dioxygenase-like lactoylglutathione lyase family enzyme
MLGHLGINLPDLGAAKSYYDEIMSLVGFESFFSAEDELAYMPAAGKRGTFLFAYPAREPAKYSRDRPDLQHLAFMVSTRSAVHTVHTRTADLGNEVLHEPRTSRSTRPRISRASGWTHSVSCSRPSAITTATNTHSGSRVPEHRHKAQALRTPLAAPP